MSSRTELPRILECYWNCIFYKIDVSTGGLDVDGETQLDELVVAGVSTFNVGCNLYWCKLQCSMG